MDKKYNFRRDSRMTSEPGKTQPNSRIRNALFSFFLLTLLFAANRASAQLPSITGTMSFCAGDSTELSLDAIGGYWVSGSPSVATVSMWSGTVYGITAGTALISYTFYGFLVITTTVTVNAAPTVGITGGGVAVCEGSNITLSGSGADSYSWSDGITDGSSFTPAVGSYTYTVTGTTGSCSSTTTTTLTVNATPTVGTTGGDVTICTGSTVTLSGTGADSYSWAGDEVTDSYPFAPGIGVHTYTVTGTTAGCSSTATTSVTVSDLPTVGISSGDITALCFGGTVTLSGTGADYYSWSDVVTNGVPFMPYPGTHIYTVTGTTSAGCSNTATTTIHVDEPITVSIDGGDVSICSGNSITLTGTGALSYEWSGGISNGTPFVLYEGVYTYTFTGTNGFCSSTATTTITVNATPTVGVSGGDVSICDGTTVTLSGTGADSYSWSDGITNGSPFTPSSGSNTYTVTGTTTAGCSATATTTVSTGGSLTLGITGGDVTLCSGSAATLTASGADSYSWSDGITNGESFTPSAGSHVYTVTGTTGGCSGTATASITVSDAPSASFTATPNPVCTGTATTFSSGAPLCSGNALSFNGSNSFANAGSALTTATDNIAMEAWVKWGGPASHYQFVFLNGHSAYNGYALIVPPFSGNLEILIGNIAFLNSSASLTIGTWQHIAIVRNSGMWSLYLDGVQYSVSEPYTSPYEPAGDFYVGRSQVTSEGFNGAIDEVKFWTSGRTTSQIAGDMIACNAPAESNLLGYWKFDEATGSTAADASGNGHTLTLGSTSWIAATETLSTYAWDFGDGTTGNVNNVAHSYTTAGTYTASLTVTNSAGCTGTATNAVTVYDGITINAGGPVTICNGASTVITATGGTTYSWAPSTGLSATTGASVTANPATTTVYTVTSTNESGCSSSATKIVSVNATAASIMGATKVCKDAVTTFTDATPGGVWTSSVTSIATVGSTGIVTGITPGTAVISYTCGVIKLKAITVNALPSVPDIGAGAGTVCPASTLTLSESTTGGTHTWMSANTATATVNASTGLVTGIASGAVAISYKYTSGCVNYAITTVTVNTVTTPSISGDTTTCAGATTTLTGTPAGGSWISGTMAKATIDASSGVLAGLTAGTSKITYTYTNEYGCAGKAFVMATVNALPTAAAIGGVASVCAGSTATFTDATTGGTWESSGSATIGTTGVATAVSAGTAVISYTYSGTNGCAKTVTKSLTVNALPDVPAITGGGVICPAGTLALADATTGGTHAWTSNNTAVATVNASTGLVTGIAGGIATISYRYTLVCTTYVATIITVNPMTTPTVTGMGTVCAGGSTTTLSATPDGGAWSSSSTSKATVGSMGIVTGLSSGPVTISYLYTNEYGCTGSVFKAMTVNAQPTVMAVGGPGSLCNGASITLTNSTTGGTWSGSTGIASIGSTGVTTGLSAGTATLSYTVTGANGCSKATTKMVTVNALPTVPAIGTGSGVVCVASVLALTESTSGGMHIWSSNVTTIATVNATTGVVTGIAAGTATISYSYTLGCTNYAATVVTVNSPVSVAAITGSSTIGIGATTTLADVTMGGTWSSNVPVVATIDLGSGSVSGASAGTTVITYRVNSCSSSFATYVVTVTTAARPGSQAVAQQAEISVYPNPANGAVNVKTSEEGTFAIYSLSGKEVGSYALATGINTITFSSNMAAGVYLCRFTGLYGNAENAVTIRLVYNP